MSDLSVYAPDGPQSRQADCAIAGGGLHGSLIALALHRRGARVLLIEPDRSLGGNHLWSFHQSDVQEEARSLLDPLVVARWPAYEVAFPDLRRRLELPYASISSERLDKVVRAELGEAVITGAVAVAIGPRSVRLADGRLLHARLVLDARGPARLQGACAFQKFAGVELRVRCAPVLPMLMDARVAQRDGYRFIYVLPLAPERVLVEDTRFSLAPTLDAEQVTQEALLWAREHGLDGEIVRREHGVLPLPLERVEFPETPGVLTAGYGGGFFHPTTGYSLPAAVQIALHVASRAPEDVFDAEWDVLRSRLRAQQRFALLLNRLLFRAMDEQERWRVFSRFHRLPERTIARFYALTTTRTDRARILCGRPPHGISLRKALQAVQA